jgi:DNA-binding CsgD family transcriptional regulator
MKKSGLLTPTEKQILTLAAQDLSVPQIKERLIKSEHTPKNHIYKAKQKLKAKTIQGAVAKAHKLGEINIDEIDLDNPKNE